MSKSNLLTSAMAAEKLGFTPDYIRRLCLRGLIRATKSGNSWMFTESAIKNIKRQRKAKERT